MMLYMRSAREIQVGDLVESITGCSLVLSRKRERTYTECWLYNAKGEITWEHEHNLSLLSETPR